MIGAKSTIANVTMTSANTEYSYAVPSRAVKIVMKLRSGSADFKLAYVSGASGTTYFTVPAGSAKSIDDWKGVGTLYFQSPTASQVMEIEVWQ